MTLEPQEFIPIEFGLSWVYIDIKSNDGEKIQFFQNINADIMSPWRNAFYVMKKEDKQILELLSEIAEKLDNILLKLSGERNE